MKAKNWWLIGLVAVSLALLASYIFLGGIIRTPEIGGRIVDAETRKPIQDVRLRVVWMGQVSLIVDRTSTIYKKETYRSSSRGEFLIPNYQRLLIPAYEYYGWQDIFVYAHGYKYQVYRRYADGSTLRLVDVFEQKTRAPFVLPTRNTALKLKPIKNKQEFADNLSFLKTEFDLESERTADEDQFIQEESDYGNRLSNPRKGQQ